MAIDTETKSRSVLANGLMSHVILPLALDAAASPHLLGWFNGTGFPITPDEVITVGGGLRSRYNVGGYRSRRT